MPVTESTFWIEELTPSRHGNPFISRGSFSDVRIAIQIPKISPINVNTNNNFQPASVEKKWETRNECTYNDVRCNDRELMQVRLVVIKRIRNAVLHDNLEDSFLDMKISQLQYKFTPSAVSEVAALYTLSNKNNITPLLSLNETNPYDSSLSLVFPYQPSDLSEIIYHRRFHSEIHESRIHDTHVKSIIGDVLSGLTHCHAHNIVHNDIKPGNLLLTSEGLVQISDFGLSRGLHKPTSMLTTGLCTLHYRPPELLYGAIDYNSSSVDIWACALVACELLTLRPLFPGRSVLDQLGRIFDVLGTPNVKTWPDVTTLPDYKKVEFSKKDGIKLSRMVHRIKINGDLDSLLNSMLCLNPSKRLKAEDCLRHSWFINNPLPSQKKEVARTLLKKEWEVKDSLSIPKSYKDKDLDTILSIAGNIAASRRANYQGSSIKVRDSMKEGVIGIKDNGFMEALYDRYLNLKD